MNQKYIFLIAVCVTTAITCAITNPCIAQNDLPAQQFAPPKFEQQRSPTTVSPYGNWSAPDSPSLAEPVNALPGSVTGQPLKPLSYPATPVPFPSGTTHTTSAPDSTVESTMNSAAEMFSNLKDSTSEKFSGIVGSLKQNSWTSKIGELFGSSDTSRMLGSLALVLGLYFAFVWVMRKINPGGNRGLPTEVIEVLGQLPFGPRRDLQLVRLGSKLLLLMNSPEGTQPIGEITDPDEVDHLASLCQGKKKSNSSAVAAIERAARRLTGSRSNETTNASTRTTEQTSTASVTDVLRALERAAKGGTVFEA